RLLAARQESFLHLRNAVGAFVRRCPLRFRPLSATAPFAPIRRGQGLTAARRLRRTEREHRRMLRNWVGGSGRVPSIPLARPALRVDARHPWRVPSGRTSLLRIYAPAIFVHPCTSSPARPSIRHQGAPPVASFKR